MFFFPQDKHCSREALLAGLKLEEQQAQSPNQSSSQYVLLCQMNLAKHPRVTIPLCFDALRLPLSLKNLVRGRQHPCTAKTQSNCESPERGSNGPAQGLSKPGLQGLHCEYKHEWLLHFLMVFHALLLISQLLL